MTFKNSRKITFEEFGDLLQREWEEGKIGKDIHESIEAGVIPIKRLREELKLIIERDGDGLRLTDDNAIVIPEKNSTRFKKSLPDYGEEGLDLAA